jgi:hypothetical protein
MAIEQRAVNQQVLLGYGVPGDTLVPPVSVAGARWEPTGADKLGPSIDGAKTDARGRRVRRLGR